MSGDLIRKAQRATVATMIAVAAVAATSHAHAQAQASGATPSKPWADPGALERTKAPAPADPAPTPVAAPAVQSANSQAAATSAAPVKPVSAAEKEKLRELSASPSPAPHASAPVRHSNAPAKHMAEPAHANHAKAVRHMHAEVRKAPVTVARVKPSHVAIENLPNKKDGYVEPAAEAQFDPFTGYRQPIRAAY